jgi:hypothetical protein
MNTISEHIDETTLVNGFQSWFAANLTELKSLFTPDLTEFFNNSIEEFAMEVYFEL